MNPLVLMESQKIISIPTGLSHINDVKPAQMAIRDEDGKMTVKINHCLVITLFYYLIVFLLINCENFLFYFQHRKFKWNSKSLAKLLLVIRILFV